MALGVRMQQRRDSESEWITSGYVLALGEIGISTDTNFLKVGDGVNTWEDLPVAYDARYLAINGKAADSELLDGISADNFISSEQVSTAATADKVAKRGTGGRLKVGTGVSEDDAVNFDQMVAANISAKKNLIIRTVTTPTTLTATDMNGILVVNNTNRNAVIDVTLPKNTTTAIAIGSWFDICASGVGAAKLVPATDVTLLSDGRVYGNCGVIRVVKSNTDTWLVTHRNDPQDAYAKAAMHMDTNTPNLSLFWRHCPLNNETMDTHNGHVTGAITGDDTDSTPAKQTNRYTCQPGQAGTYRVSGMVMIDAGASTRIASRIIKNGLEIPGGYGAGAPITTSGESFTGDKLVTLAEGDWVGLQGYCEITNWNFVVFNSGVETSWMTVERIA